VTGASTAPGGRSNAPLFWLLFGAGGMLAALLGPVLVFVTGIAVPLGFTLPADLLSYPRLHALAQHWLGKGFLFVVVTLFAWHAVHRLLHSLHDLGLRTGIAAKLLCYGSAALLTVVSATGLLVLGF
jgi:fumarate reductase subunit D